MKTKQILVAFLILAGTFTACKKDKAEPEAVKPSVQNVEIGYANNKRAIRGRDFHLNADVLAGSKITSVMVKILQKTGQTYSANWKLEITWDEFKGVKTPTYTSTLPFRQKHQKAPTTSFLL